MTGSLTIPAPPQEEPPGSMCRCRHRRHALPCQLVPGQKQPSDRGPAPPPAASLPRPAEPPPAGLSRTPSPARDDRRGPPAGKQIPSRKVIAAETPLLRNTHRSILSSDCRRSRDNARAPIARFCFCWLGCVRMASPWLHAAGSMGSDGGGPGLPSDSACRRVCRWVQASGRACRSAVLAARSGQQPWPSVAVGYGIGRTPSCRRSPRVSLSDHFSAILPFSMR